MSNATHSGRCRLRGIRIIVAERGVRFPEPRLAGESAANLAFVESGNAGHQALKVLSFEGKAVERHRFNLFRRSR